jgi:DNA-binding response OmpR family regulator
MSKARILIVEDNGDLAEMLNEYFSRVQDYEVVTAAWGAEALEIARQQHFNLIVLDIRLPDISGYDVCRQLRLQPRTQDIPILFLTEKRDRIDKLQGLELGVVDYITKPFDIQELSLRMRNALSRATQKVHTDPITELPDGVLVDERLIYTIYNQDDWALVTFALSGLDAFRERYGFVAADDVLRAVALMIRNAVREQDSDEDFIGHLDTSTFVAITQVHRAESIRERVQTKMEYSRDFFYPMAERTEPRLAEEMMLGLQAVILDRTSGDLDDAEAVRARIAELFAAQMG